MNISEEVMGRTLKGLGKSFDDLSGELADAFNAIVTLRRSIFNIQQVREKAEMIEGTDECSLKDREEFQRLHGRFGDLVQLTEGVLKPKYSLVCPFLGLDPDALNHRIDQSFYQIELEKSGIRLG